MSVSKEEADRITERVVAKLTDRFKHRCMCSGCLPAAMVEIEKEVKVEVNKLVKVEEKIDWHIDLLIIAFVSAPLWVAILWSIVKYG